MFDAGAHACTLARQANARARTHAFTRMHFFRPSVRRPSVRFVPFVARRPHSIDMGERLVIAAYRSVVSLATSFLHYLASGCVGAVDAVCGDVWHAHQAVVVRWLMRNDGDVNLPTPGADAADDDDGGGKSATTTTATTTAPTPATATASTATPTN